MSYFTPDILRNYHSTWLWYLYGDSSSNTKRSSIRAHLHEFGCRSRDDAAPRGLNYTTTPWCVLWPCWAVPAWCAGCSLVPEGWATSTSPGTGGDVLVCRKRKPVLRSRKQQQTERMHFQTDGFLSSALIPLKLDYNISSFAVTAQDTRPFDCPRSILIKMLLIHLWWAIKQSRIPTAWFMCLYILLLASLAWLQRNYVWICLVVDARAAEVSWIFLSLILEHAEDTALLLNKRIIKPPPVTTIISKCIIAGLRPKVSWGVQGQVSWWWKRRKLLFHQAESVPGRSPVVWKQMVPSADWEKVCVSSRNTAAMMELCCTAPCFARTSEPCIKSAALWSHSTPTIMFLAISFPPYRLFLPYIAGCFCHNNKWPFRSCATHRFFSSSLCADLLKCESQTVTQGDRLQWRNKSVQETAGGHIICQHRVVLISPIMSAVQFPVFEFALVLMMFTPGCGIWRSVAMLVLWKKDQSD